jgi:prolipoprotein diacylglyceryltransferase
MFAAYLMWYSFGRFFVESIRLDPSDVFFGLRSNQISALVGVLVGLALFMIQRARQTGIETTGYLPGRFNKQLAQDSAKTGENEQNSDVQGTEVGLTQSTEEK